MQARSMEIYQQLGLSDQVVAEGQKKYGMNFFKKGKNAASVSVVNPDEDASPFPYLMMYEQSKNEKLLYTHLLSNKRDISWNTEGITIKKTDEGYTLRIKKDGTDRILQCKYLIACDDAKSVARDFAQMPLKAPLKSVAI
jgi:2-polyprenyl-6-methoxyphenol hydroxylase-like FAD-dependent oxidoreductase